MDWKRIGSVLVALGAIVVAVRAIQEARGV